MNSTPPTHLILFAASYFFSTASAWQKRMGALNELTAYIQSSNAELVSDIVPAFFVLIKQSTSSFKESNFNVTKGILSFFTALFMDVYVKLTRAPDSYLVSPATKIAVEKIADKKLAESSISCLNSLCVVKDPQKVISLAIKHTSDIKSPSTHEALLTWFKTFLEDFGTAVLSASIQDVVAWILSVSFTCTRD
jgi:hypothetical protein